MQSIIKNWYYNQTEIGIEAVSSALNVTVPRAYHIVSGNFKRLTCEQVVQLCRLIQITPNELFGYPFPPETNSAAPP